MRNGVVVVASALVITAFASSCASLGHRSARQSSSVRSPATAGTASGSSISRSTESPVSYAPVVSSSRDPGLSPTAALEQVLPRLDRGVLTNPHIGTSPEGSRTGPWFYATVTCREAHGGCVPFLWQADLAQGAVAELMNTTEANLANVVVGSTLQVRMPDGSLDHTDYGGQGDVAAEQRFVAADESDAQIVSDAERTITADGFTATTVKVYRPLGPALYVVARMPTGGHSSVTLGQLATDLDGRQAARFEGSYVELDAPDGSPIGRSAVSRRTGAGRLWSDSRYEDEIGIVHGGHPTA